MTSSGPAGMWSAVTRRLAAVAGPAATCPACGRPLTMTMTISLTGLRYCNRHDGGPRCIACMAPADPDVGTEVALCRLCEATSVRSQQDVKRVLPPIAAELRQLQIRTTAPVRVRLVTAAEVNSHQPGHGDALGMTVSRGGNVVDLMVVRDLPYTKFGSTVAHEVMHAYLTQQGFPQLPPQVAEGLCQLLAYAWVRRRKDPQASAELRLIAETTDPVYGDGFRRARASAERIGVRATLDHVRRHRDFPSANSWRN
ncbi:MAG: protein DA1 [Actinoplanes sp.]